MIISLIVAIGEDGVIGNKNQLPWHLPADLKYFKKITSGHTIIMGRKTHESIGKALPNRHNIIITRNINYKSEGVSVFTNIKEAISVAHSNNETECFVIGGAELFKEAMLYSNKMYITHIHQKFEGDVYFNPEYSNWNLIACENHLADEVNMYDFTFEVYEKK
jgi:dihydrofolate reductase